MIFSFSHKGSIGVIHGASSIHSLQSFNAADEINTLTDFLATPEIKAALIVIDTNLHRVISAIKMVELLNAIKKANIPVAALLSNNCYDNELLLAYTCHFRFAVDTVSLHFPPLAGSGKLHELLLELNNDPVKLINVLSDKHITVQTAFKHNYISMISDKATAEKKAIEFLHSLTQNRSSFCVRSAMQSILNSYRLPMKQALEEECKLFLECVKNAPKTF